MGEKQKSKYHINATNKTNYFWYFGPHIDELDEAVTSAVASEQPITLNSYGGRIEVTATLSFKAFSSTKLRNEYGVCWNVELRYVNTKK
ncbi:hypothetical protein CNR22_00185 [Sphingobacteriaceae bacterium]|nr:hypothetical protein CNR22_00185 [Sphingobacteriaceae bacterium]